jgi:hypothetical protein
MELPTLLAGIITSHPQRYSDADYRRNSKSDSDHLSATHEADHEQRESHFEVLLLSLGLMINFVQESDSTKELVLSSPIPTSILHIFEKLLSRDVSPPPSFFDRADFGGTCKSCFGIPRFTTRTSDAPVALGKSRVNVTGYEELGPQIVG